MKKSWIAVFAMVFALVIGLSACGAEHSLELELLEDVSGVKVTADHAGQDNVVSSEGAITVGDGDVIVISPCMDEGSFHLTITSEDGTTMAFDEDVDGRILFQIGAVPGVYNVEVSGNNATGWMTVFAMSSETLDAENASLEEALTEQGVDPSIISQD